MRVGDVELQTVSDGLFMADGGAVFGLVPKVMWERVVKPDSLNRIPLWSQSLVIRSGGKTILVETGWGPKLGPKDVNIYGIQRERSLIEDLAVHGIAPEDVDILINTHLHADHSGGNTILKDGVPVPTFPRAEYWIQRKEWEDAMNANERTRATYLPENLLPVQESGQLKLVDGETQVTKDVRCIISPGHVPAHQSVVIESQGQTAIFAGDIAQYNVQMERLGWVSAFDIEPMVSIETKRKLMNWIVERNATLIAVHQPFVGKVEKNDRGFKLIPLE